MSYTIRENRRQRLVKGSAERAAAIREYKCLLKRYRWLRTVGNHAEANVLQRDMRAIKLAYNL